MKRTELRRKTPLRTRTPSTSTSTPSRGSGLNRRSRVNPVSAKTAARREERAEVRETTLERDGRRCVARHFVPGIACTDALEVDEDQGRGREPGSQYDDTKTQTLCSRCHPIKTTHPRAAGLLGLYGPVEQLRRFTEEGTDGLLDALREWARAKGIAAGRGPGWGGDPQAVARFAAQRGVNIPERWNP